MFCKNCGRQLPDNAAFCPGCGEKRPDGEAYADGRSSTDIRNLPNYAKEIDRSGHAVDSDRKKFSLSDPDRKKFSLSDSGREKFSLSDKSRKDDGGGIVRLTSSREKAAPPKESPAPPKESVVPTKEPVATPKEPAAQPKNPVFPTKEPAAQPKEQTGFVNPLKDSGGTVFRFGDTSGVHASEPTENASAASPATSAQEDASAASPATFVQQEYTAPREPDEVIEGKDGASGFVNPLKKAGLDIHLGSDGDRNQPADDSGEINSPHLKFAVWMVILSCTCCNPVTLILGIIAIVFAFQVAASSRSGNLGIALQKAAVARVLCWITFGLLAVWISLLVAMLCLPMPEDHTQKDVTKENQTEQVEDENAEKPAEQAEDESSMQESQTEEAEGENVESAKPDIHHSPLNLLLDILD